MSEAGKRERIMEQALLTILYSDRDVIRVPRAKALRAIADRALQDVQRSRDIENEADRLFEQWAVREEHSGSAPLAEAFRDLALAAIQEHERRMFHPAGGGQA